MGLIPEHILEEIQSANDIVEVISGYIPLKKAGKDYKALCPFHNEKSPSFMVSPHKQLYYCFGCGEGGSVIGFVMKYERLEFLDAVRMLAERGGVQIPVLEEGRHEGQGKDRLYKVNEFAAACYHDFLMRDPAAEKARQYIAKRGLLHKTVEMFSVGYAPARWDFIVQRAMKAGYSKKELLDSGLAAAKEGAADSCYDRFRDRIVFPVWNAQGKAAGFSARVLDASLPKYVNTPETAVYNKGTLLYGLNLAKDEVIEKGSVIICEGHLDLIALFQAGIRNACASQGTAFTATHAKLLKRYAEGVVCAFDGDSAGEAATLRSCEIFIAEGLAVRIAVMPKGFDPDRLIREKGTEGFEQVMAAAQDLFDFKLALLRKKIDPATLAGKTRIAAEMLATINQFPSAVAKSESIRRLADALDVKEEALLHELKKGREPGRHEAAAGGSEEQQPLPPWERDYIALALEDHRFIGAIGAICSLDDFQDERARRILSAMMTLRDENRLNHAALVNGLADRALKDTVSSLAFRSPEGVDLTTLFRDYLFAIRQKSLMRDMAVLSKRIAGAEQKGADYSSLLAEVEAKKTLLNNLRKEVSLFSETFK